MGRFPLTSKPTQQNHIVQGLVHGFREFNGKKLAGGYIALTPRYKRSPA